MKPVVIVGGFDDIRSRDIRFIAEAAKRGPLTVQLLSDAALGAPKFAFEERAYILNRLRFVEKVEAAGPLPTGTCLAVRERDASTVGEQAARASGLDYCVIADSALNGFPRAAARPPSGGKVVAVSGCYDWLHSGHFRFFEEAAELGDLHVFLGSDATISDLKGPGHPQFPQDERRYVVDAACCVHATEISRGSGWLDFADDVLALRPDLFVVNEDGDKPAKRDFCQQAGIAYRVLKRTPADGLPVRSSTALRGF